jgi:hypothetical protein
VNEHGIVRATQLALPAGASIRSLLPSSDGMFYVRVGHSSRDPYGAAGPEGVAMHLQKAIYVFNSIDGSLVSKGQFSADLSPIAAADGTYTFLAARREDGRIQLVSGTVSR